MSFFVHALSASAFAFTVVVACLGLALGATPGSSTAGTAGAAAAPADSAPATIVRSGEKLAHPKLGGSLGPWPAVELWLTQSSLVDDGPFSARVVVRDAAGKSTIHTLPQPDETESAFMMQVRAVMFRSIDGNPERSLIVLYSAVRIGPGQTPYHAACVYAWNGDAFVRDTDVEQRLAGARNSADVARRLAPRKSP